MTQCEMIIKYLEDFGSITPREAEDELGVMRLASRIWDLRSRGYKIRKEDVKRVNRYGKKTTFARYSLIKEEEKR